MQSIDEDINKLLVSNNYNPDDDVPLWYSKLTNETCIIIPKDFLIFVVNSDTFKKIPDYAPCYIRMSDFYKNNISEGVKIYPVNMFELIKFLVNIFFRGSFIKISFVKNNKILTWYYRKNTGVRYIESYLNKYSDAIIEIIGNITLIYRDAYVSKI
jgi:hypothetical protein